MVTIIVQEGSESSLSEIVDIGSFLGYGNRVSKPKVNRRRIVWARARISRRRTSGARFRFYLQPAVVDGFLYFGVAENHGSGMGVWKESPKG